MRLARQTRFPALLAVAALAALALLAPTGGAQSTARCSAAQLSGKVRLSSGAAGTAAVSIADPERLRPHVHAAWLPEAEAPQWERPAADARPRRRPRHPERAGHDGDALPGREGEPPGHLFDGAHGGRDLVRPRDEPRDLPRQRAREAHDPVLRVAVQSRPAARVAVPLRAASRVNQAATRRPRPARARALLQPERALRG